MLTKALFFFVPWDLIRIVSIVTPLDIVTVIWFLFQARPRFALPTKALAPILLFILGILIGGIIYSKFALENLKLGIAFLITAVKVLAVHNAFRNLNLDNESRVKYVVKQMAHGAIALSVVNTMFVFVSPSAFSGSGRLMSLFGSSNGLAAFACISIVLIYGARSVGVISRPLFLFGFLLTVLLALLSISRGAIIFVVLFIFFIRPFMATVRKDVSGVAVRTIGNVILVGVLLFSGYLLFGETLSRTFPQVELMAARLESLATFAETGRFGDLDKSRTDMNKAVVETLQENGVSWFGYGQTSSYTLTPWGLAPHNLPLYSLYEFGFFGFLLMMYVMLLMMIKPIYMRQAYYSGRYVNYFSFLTALGFSLAFFALKTPFYFQKSFVWVVFWLNMEVASQIRMDFLLTRRRHEANSTTNETQPA